MSDLAMRPQELGIGRLFETVRDEVIVANAETGRIVLWNPSATAVFGYSLSEALEMNVEDLVPEPLKARHRAGISRYQDTGHGSYIDSRAAFELPAVRKGGGQLYFELTLSPIEPVHESDREGRFVLAIVRDVTERKRAEEEIRRLNEELEDRVERRTAQLEAANSELREHGRRLRESEERYRLVVESSNDGVFDWNVRTGEIFWNDRLFEIVGLSSDEVTPSFELFVELLHPEDRRRVTDAMTAHLERGSEYDVECRVRHSDGSYRFCHVRGETQRDENGSASRMTGVVQDVTERKRAEEALKESEARYRTLVEQMPAITYIEAPDVGETEWNILYVSPQIEDLFGYSPDEWMAESELWRRVHPDDRELVLTEDARTEASGEPFTMEYRVLIRDGNAVWVRDEALLVRDEEGRPMFWQGIIQDITEHKRYEVKLAALVEELARSNVEVEQFAYVASHDLQEPLRMVAIYTQQLARRYEGKLDEDADELIGYAVDGANRMQKLINDLLTYSRVGTKGKEFEPTVTRAAFEAACANLRRAIEEVGAEVVSVGELPTVMGDQSQLVQLFQNLIANAIKFAREGEVARVEVGSERPSEGEWLFSVRDNGIGMDARYAERIFVIVQQLHGKEEYGGTWKGLAVCKKIVERHEGRIWVESEEGEGSTFYFTLRPWKKGD